MIEWVSESNELPSGRYFSWFLWTLKWIAVIQQGKILEELEWKMAYFQEVYDLCSFQLFTLNLHVFAYSPPVNKQFHKFGFYQVV